MAVSTAVSWPLVEMVSYTLGLRRVMMKMTIILTLVLTAVKSRLVVMVISKRARCVMKREKAQRVTVIALSRCVVTGSQIQAQVKSVMRVEMG
jgi:hypothetical protein